MCKFCEPDSKKRTISGNYGTFSIGIYSEIPCLNIGYEDITMDRIRVKIDFCPMCGREL